MTSGAEQAIAIVGLGGILPDAPDVPAFWQNIRDGRYSIREVPAERWSVEDYYDPDPLAPDKSYSKIGGWVRGFQFDWKRFRIPPRVAAAMDEGQQWAVSIAAEALADYGYPERPLDLENTGVILGTAMGGELHYRTNLRISFPEYARVLSSVGAFSGLPAGTREAILTGFRETVGNYLPPITEDSMPGELPNIVSGRVANVLNLNGPNFITDAACASSFAAIEAAMEMLHEHRCDAVLAGGVDRNMGASTFVKFCKIGALSATGTRPFGEGADGFVMGEGSGIFLLKRLSDAERDGDRIYAVLRGVGSSSDGKGKGITAPNPIGQVLAISRAWKNAGLDPASATLVEAHGTSTRVGDVVEVESLNRVFGAAPRGSIAIGSVKSNIGHLKAGAGAAGFLKTVLALHHKVLPPTLNARRPNPNIDFGSTPFYLNHELNDWPQPQNKPRRAGVSAYGFGGTNFHLVVEEHVPGALTREPLYASAVVSNGQSPRSMPIQPAEARAPSAALKEPPRGILALGAGTTYELKDVLASTLAQVSSGWAPEEKRPEIAALKAHERIVIDYGDREELLARLQKAQKAISLDTPQAWRPLQTQGIFRGSNGRPGKVAFLFPGQGSQYVNMGSELAALQPIFGKVFAEADSVMGPILGRPLTSYIFIDPKDPEAVRQGEADLKQTAITQPAMLTMDIAFFRLLEEYGFRPDMVMGHSLGEYAALVASGVMPFAHALEAAAARGREMTRVSVEDSGWMAAVMAPFDVVEKTLATVDGYVVAANLNSYTQSVIGGASQAVEQAIQRFTDQGFRAVRIPVSHAFHTRIVAPASPALRQVLERMDIRPPAIPILANVTGDYYPASVDGIRDILEQQIASPVLWAKELERAYESGARAFMEIGPKRVLKGFVDDVLGEKADVLSLFANHPRVGELQSFNHLLCGLYAAGYGFEEPSATPDPDEPRPSETRAEIKETAVSQPVMTPIAPAMNGQGIEGLASALAQALAQARPAAAVENKPYDRNDVPLGSVVISGTGLGLPGAEKPIMDPDNALRILRGEQFVDLIPERFRKKMLDKRVTRVVKSEDGSGGFQAISEPDEVIRLAGRPGSFNLTEEYGVSARLVEALDMTTQLAMAAGIDALREAGIPLVRNYRRATTGRYLPDRWMLPEALRDETGVIFASAFPGLDRLADEFERYYAWQNRHEQVEMLESLRESATDPAVVQEITRRLSILREEIARESYDFDRRFLFRVLSMGHSQFAEYIGARGPNTQVNAACASTAQAIAIAEDWIRSGRCRRVLVIGADIATSDHLLEWIGAGFLASGAAATDDRVDEAALPFDRRRHGTLMGMGACALVVESEDTVRERGMRGLVELLSSETNNSAYHGTRLDVTHMGEVMNSLITSAERRFGIDRRAIASQTVFMSHETFTPARGGSAAAEVAALRYTFDESASEIIMANTKGFTGHPMGVGVEDVIAVKILEYGIVPPVPNFREVDPDLGPLTLSRGGRYPVQYAIHLAAGFGSQIAMTLTRRIPGALDRVDNKGLYQQWLNAASGYDRAETEVVKRTLRVVDQGAPTRSPAPATWQRGTGPTKRTVVAGDIVAFHPAPVTYQTPPREVVPSTPPVPAREPATAQPVPEVRAPVVLSESEPRNDLPKPQAALEVMELEAQVEPSRHTPIVTEPAPQLDMVKVQVLRIVAEKTGYPMDMLDLDLDMEADLGIDTVKQAETFAAIRAAFDIPRRDDLRLRDYPTLEKVIDFVYEMRPDLAQAAPASEPTTAPSTAAVVEMPPSSAEPAPAADTVRQQVLQIVADKTGYPVEMLDLDLDMEADLGIDTVKQAETFAAIRTAFDIPRRDDLRLRDYPTLEKVIEFVYEMRPDLTEVPAEIQAPLAAPATPRAVPVIEAAPPAATDAVRQQVLQIVADKTGYPVEMLDLDLDMEADLGIDTVKQAETFAAIRAAFDIPRRDDLRLRDYPTLETVIGFVYEMLPDLRQSVQVETRESATPTETVLSTPPAAVESPSEVDSVKERVLQIVADKTGYPLEMLDLDLDMEADLGIDTVKQAETFAAIRTAFDIPRRDDLRLRDYPTLETVIGFVYEMRPDLRQSVPAAVAEPEKRLMAVEAEAAAPQPVEVTRYDIQEADRVPRRVPVPSLRPPLDWCKPTGVTLDEASRVLVMMDCGGVGKALVGRLEKLGVTVLILDDFLSVETLETQLKAWLADGPIQGVYWLPALDVEPTLEEMDLTAWRAATQLRVKNLYTTMRLLYNSVSAPGTFLLAATRLGGLFGYDDQGAVAPLGGAVAGFTKAYKRERPEALVKVVDFEAGRRSAAPAEALIAETVTDPGIVEIGYHDGQRFTITLDERPAADGQPGMTLDSSSLFVVTGAAGGITSAIVTDLAVASGGIFYLLDLVPEPRRDSEEIVLFRDPKGREALKLRLIETLKAEGERPTPVKVDRMLFAIEREEAALRAIEAVEAAGGRVSYRSVNLLDGKAVESVIDEIRQQYGRIDVLLHAGGLEISRALPDKEPGEFDLVFDVKADGFYNLLHAARGMPIGATVAFSSVAGRFGNSGQTDYSAANDLLCKVTSSLKRWRPETRGIVIDWTAWGGIGMATRGSIPLIMEAAGIDMLPPESGIPTVRRELTAGAARGEIVVGQRLGVMMAEFDPTGGLDPEKAGVILAGREQTLPMIGDVTGARLYGGVEVETTLDPRMQPFLYDHQLSGTPLLPGVMGTETFAELAASLAPGYRVAAVERVQFLSPFKFYRMEPRTLFLSAWMEPLANGDLLAHAMLRSVTQPPRAELPAQVREHFVAEVRLSSSPLEQPVTPFEAPAVETLPITADEIYRVYFHGPAYQVLERARVEEEQAIGLMAAVLPAELSPEGSELLMAPRLIELCLQTAGLWEIAATHRMALPLAIGSVTTYRKMAEAVGRRLFAVVTPVNGGTAFAARVVDDAGNLYVTLDSYRTVSTGELAVIHMPEALPQP